MILYVLFSYEIYNNSEKNSDYKPGWRFELIRFVMLNLGFVLLFVAVSKQFLQTKAFNCYSIKLQSGKRSSVTGNRMDRT